MSEPMICIWDLGTPCSGDVSREWTFDNQLEIPMCEKHLEEHRKIMFVYDKGYDMDFIFQLSPEVREKLFRDVRAQYPDKEFVQ